MIERYGEYMEELKTISESNDTDGLQKFKKISEKLKGTNYFDFRWPHGESILHWAASGGQDSICQYLLDLGSYVNAENIYGCNPIFYASLKEKVSTVKLLLEAGANFESKSVFSGGTPYDPVNQMQNSFGNQLSPERQEIRKLIKSYMIVKEESCRQSDNFSQLFKSNTRSRDYWELNWRKEKTDYGGNTSQGYWGLPNTEAYQKFKEIDRVDKKITYILENPKKWCRNCFKNEKDDDIKALRCSRCKKVYYCSRECQKEDYKRHRRYENQYANISA